MTLAHGEVYISHPTKVHLASTQSINPTGLAINMMRSQDADDVVNPVLSVGEDVNAPDI